MLIDTCSRLAPRFCSLGRMTERRRLRWSYTCSIIYNDVDLRIFRNVKEACLRVCKGSFHSSLRVWSGCGFRRVEYGHKVR